MKTSQMIELVSIVQTVHSDAKQKGFWENKSIESFTDISSKLSLIHSEVSEADQELRLDKFLENQDKFLEELADVVIRTFDLAGFIDAKRFGELMEQKIITNREREYQHNKRG